MAKRKSYILNNKESTSRDRGSLVALRRGGNTAGAAPLPRLRHAQRGLCGRPRFHTGKVASGGSHPPTPPAPKDKEAMRWALHLLLCEEAAQQLGNPPAIAKGSLRRQPGAPIWAKKCQWLIFTVLYGDGGRGAGPLEAERAGQQKTSP